MSDAAPEAEIAVLGGSGFYRFLDRVTEHRIDTPYGEPSSPVAVGTVGDRRVAFIARHGTEHQFPPHRINYRANLWALHALGVERVFGPCASGSLQPHIHPGEFVVCDQLVDQTRGRAATFFDGPAVHHVTWADPYCDELRAVAADAVEAEGVTVHRAGTAVVIPGPRFATRAESRWYRSAGWDVINMTQHPEAYLARELGLCYSAIALVTDYDTGVEDDPSITPVTMAEIVAFLEQNVVRVQAVLQRAIAAVPAERSCSCADAASDEPITPPAP